MHHLIIDVGNTSSKVGIYLEESLIFYTREFDLTTNLIEQIILRFEPTSYILSNVDAKNEKVETYLKQVLQGFILSESISIPIKNDYQTPHTLGSDRLANAVAAASLYPNRNVFIIDAGTCLKFDFISSESIYKGGAISLGLQMRANALHNYTAKLPLMNSFNWENEIFELIGNSTISSLQSGIANGIIFETTGFIEAFAKIYDDIIVLLTGGDSDFFEKHLKTKIFAHPNLTLYGLHKILEHQLKMN